MIPLVNRDFDDSSTLDDAANGPEDAHFGANDIGWQALGPALGCTLLATVVVAARWYSRCRIARCVGADDYVILLSLLLSWALTTIIGIAVHEGAGIYHTPGEASQITRLVIAANALWILIVNITKASILSQYLRLFRARLTRTLTHLLVAALAPAALYALFHGILLCRPVAKLWSPSLPGTCASAQTYWLSVAGLDITLDALVLLLPLPAILALRLPSSRQKAALVALFTLGFLVCVVAVVRLLTVYLAAQRGEYVHSGVWAIVWSAVEANTGIVCACLLALKPLATRILPGWFEGEGETPGRATRLKTVDTSGARWSRVGGGVPATSSSGWSGSRRVEWVGGGTLGGLENLSVLERERERSRDARGEGDCEREGRQRMGDGEEDLSIWEMLRRPGEVVVRSPARGSG